MADRPKALNLLAFVQTALASGGLRYSAHARERMLERGIIKPEVEYILVAGHHSKRKDQFNEEHEAWDYAIEGKTIDGRPIRVIVAIVAPAILVVTAIDLR